MGSRSIEDLEKTFREKARVFSDILRKDKRITFIFTCTYRSNEEQEVLYMQGREKLTVVNEMRKKIQLQPITEYENKIVTYAKAGESKHNYRKAFDIAILDNNKIIWDHKHIFYKIAGDVAKSLNIAWGGDWKKFKEYVHFEDI